MGMVNADVAQLLLTSQKIKNAIISIETTKSSLTKRIQQLGCEWKDQKYRDLEIVVYECNKALTQILATISVGQDYITNIVSSLQEYESIKLESSSCSTPIDSSTRSSNISAFVGQNQYPSDTFGPQIQLMQDRLSNERYFSRGEHFEKYREFWESGNYPYTRCDSPQIVYVRARDIEGVYIWDKERENPQGFWTRNGRSGWSRENIMRRASHIEDVRQNMEAGANIEDIEDNPELSETIGSYYREPVQVASLGSFYVFQSDGRHRILAAQTLDTYIPVLITTRYTQN